jgi:hypothetical protein
MDTGQQRKVAVICWMLTVLSLSEGTFWFCFVAVLGWNPGPHALPLSCGPSPAGAWIQFHLVLDQNDSPDKELLWGSEHHDSLSPVLSSLSSVLSPCRAQFSLVILWVSAHDLHLGGVCSVFALGFLCLTVDLCVACSKIPWEKAVMGRRSHFILWA